MFGYATDETDECMPLTILLAHKLNQKLAELRYSGALPWLRPDSKAQVGIVDGRREERREGRRRGGKRKRKRRKKKKRKEEEEKEEVEEVP